MPNEAPEVVEYLNQERQAGTASALAFLGEDPEKAARAIELGRASGVNPDIIHSDLEGFEEQHKAALTHDFLHNNPVLQAYAASDPMAAKVSADDWGHLDEITKILDKVGSIGLMRKAIEGFKEGFGPEPSGAWAEQVRPQDQQFSQEHPQLYDFIKRGAQAIGEPLELGARLFAGALRALQTGGEEAFVQTGMDRSEAKRAARDLTAAIEMQALTSPHAPLGELHTPAKGARELPGAKPEAKVGGEEQQAIEAARAAMPYIKAGEEPPLGLHPFIDKLKQKQSEADLKNLDELVNESQNNATRERAPEYYEKLLTLKNQGVIGISAEKVAELYKNKLPEPEDGILGFIPNLVEQMNVALATGGDVEVSTAKWTAYVDKEVAKELHDFIRPRKGGVTKAEGEVLSQQLSIFGKKESELDLPMVPQDHIRLFRGEREDNIAKGGWFTNDFEIAKQYGVLNYIDLPIEKAKSFLASEPKEGMHDVYFIPKAEQELRQSSQPIAGVRKAAGLEPRFEEPIKQELRTKTRQIQLADVTATVTDTYTKNEREIITEVYKVIRRIGGDAVEIAPATKLEIAGREIQGAFTVFKNKDAIIQWSLKSDDPTWTGRHEVMHYLREYGFFKETEWDTLVAAAMDDDWIKKHNIEARYPNLPKEIQFEEAIAEEFPYWVKSGGMEGRVGQIFQKIMQLLQDVRAAVARVLGHEPTYEELFAATESGALRKRGPQQETLSGSNQTMQKGKQGEQVGKTRFEQEIEEFEQKNNLAPATTEQIITAMQARIRSIEYDRRLNKVEGEEYPPHAELSSLRRRIKELRDELSQKMSEKQGELDVTRQEDKKLFATIAGWMNKADQEYYMSLLKERTEQDAAFQLKKAERFERKRQSEEWKAAEAEIRSQVEADVSARPDVGALEFFRSGKLYGEETGTRPRVDPSQLTSEQRKLFPEKYQRRDGMAPDDVANLFGYPKFDDLAAKLTELDAAVGNKSTGDFVKGLVNSELERQLTERFGDKDENILREAQEHVVSPTQMDLLHEELIGFVWKKELDVPFTKAEMKAWAEDTFKQAKASTVSAVDSLRQSGMAWRKVELAMQEGDVPSILKFKQEQLRAMYMADAAIKFEKERDAFERVTKRFSKREVTGVLPEYTNFIHDILMRTGHTIRSVQDLTEAVERSGFKDLDHFVDSKEADLREVPVAAFLRDPNFRKALDEMTVEEYRAVVASVKTLEHNGKNELKIIREGDAADLQTVKDGMNAQLEEFSEKKIDVTKPAGKGLRHGLRVAWASLLQIEALFNRWDRGDRNGLFTKYISLPLADASNNFASLERSYGAQLRELRDKVNLNERVDNPIFREPTAGGYGELMQFNRGNLRAILRYAGRPIAFEKLAKGYGLEPAQVLEWLHRTATKEDWDWASKQGKIFDKVFEEASQMYQRLTGVAPEKSDVAPVQTPFGEYPGWYHPIDYDQRFPGPSKRLMGGDALEERNYVRATTPAGYTKKVTGYNAPMSLDIANTAEHLRGMLHDIAYREAVIEASKIFYDHTFQRTIDKHYGREYRNLLVPYLRDVANVANFRSEAQAYGAKVSEFLRQNIIGTLIGFNPGTVMKHGLTAWVNSMNEVGSLRFLEAVKDMFQRDPTTGDRNWSFALEHSEELQRRHRNYIETLRGSETEALGQTSWREMMLRGGAWTVSKADLASAVPTWLAEYRHSMEQGRSHGDAISDGNRAVRRAHGSSVITNRPAAMRGGQAAQWMTSLYGFFSHMLNKQFELMWRARETFGKFSEREYKSAAKDVPQLSSMFFAYIMFPALIEELVTPLSNDERESWAMWSGKTLAKGVSSSWPIVRDLAHAALSFHRSEPSAGLFTSSLKAGIDITRDMKDPKRSFSKERAGQTIQHGITAFGALTGLANQQEGRVARFMYNMNTGQEKPKGPWQFAVGMRFGQTKGHSKSFDDYMHGLIGKRK